ncbi:PST family polysaccharide transporter [Paenibacillus sp. DS2015]|uniref:oligosaccharide flippase family protein n=1 Tax=Paenibacillus sp. DS2015 TaxID=3373917 RepID=UPI003D21BA58
MMTKMKKVFHDPSNPVWVFLNQFFSRGAVALKFLLIARILGPESVGLISVALICLALMEAMTELGMLQAIVQRKENPTKQQLDTLWTFLFLRGVAITVTMICVAPLMAHVFNASNAVLMIYLIAFVPLFRNSASIGLYEQIRDRNFKLTSTIQAVTVSIDFILCVILILYNNSPISAILSMLIAEIVRTIVTHIVLHTRPKFSFAFKSIKDITSYGKWIWGHSISSFVFTQMDKVIASRFLGVTILGLYQMGQKLTQMAIADISFAFGQYLFPTFSKMNRESSRTLYLFYRVNFSLMISFCALTSIFMVSNSEFIIRFILGNSWMSLIDIMGLLVISASLAATVNISVMFVRAIGNPKLVTILTYVQVAVYVIVLLIIGHVTVNTLILASIIGLMITNMSLLGYIVYRADTPMVMDLVRSSLLTLLLSASLWGTSIIFQGQWLHFIITLGMYFLLIVTEYKIALKRSHTSKQHIDILEGALESN